MPDSEHPAPSGTAPSPTCGNCGAPAPSTDLICPACGVLLAAYQAPAGATSAGAGPVFSTPSFNAPAFAPPPVHQPKSQSPIGDALKRSRNQMDAARFDDVRAQAAAEADELSRMAGGVDELSDMADGNDELSDMADGVDELSEMAAGGDTALARQIEAELAGAKVTFAGDAPVIETDQVEIMQTPGDKPAIVESKPAVHPEPTNAIDRLSKQAGIRGVYDHPMEETGAPAEYPEPPSAAPVDESGFDLSMLIRWLPFILIGVVILGFGRSMPGIGALIGILLVVGLIVLLLKWTAASSRKTSSMPRDDSWNRKKRR